MANESNFKKIARATGKTIEFLVRAVIALSLSAIAYLGFNSPNGQKIINDLLGKTSSTNTPNPLDQAQPPTETPQPGETPSPTNIPSTPESSATQTPLPEVSKPVDRMSAWLNFRPDTAEEAAAIFGGSAADWTMSKDWDGTKVNLVDGNGNPVENYGVIGYKPIEWKTTTQDTDPNAPHYWPTKPVDAANRFFPGQNIDPRFLEQNKFGGWHLLEDEHLISGGPGDKSLNLHPGEVAEGYTVGPDGLMKTQDDRVWVAFGGKDDGINAGISLPRVSGQGITVWPPGTDLMKIALEAGNEYNNNTHYRDAHGNKLGPDPVNFPVPPIYNAPGYDIIGSVQRNVVQQINDMALPPKIVSNPQAGQIRFEAVGSIPTRPSFASTLPGSSRDPFKGMSRAKRNFGGNGNM